MSTTIRQLVGLVAVSVVVLLIGGLSYWVLKGSWQSVAPQSSAPPASTAAATPAPTVATSTAPPTSTAGTPLAPPPAAAATSAPPVATSTTEAPPAPPATATASTAPPASTGATASGTQSLPVEADISEANRRQIQEALRRLEYYEGSVDGIFGPLTPRGNPPLPTRDRGRHHWSPHCSRG